MIFSTHQIFIGIYVVLHGKQENNFVPSCESKTYFFSIFLEWGRKVQFLSLTDYKSTNSFYVLFDCFLEVLHSDIFYKSNIYWNTRLREGQKIYNNSHYVKVRLVFF